MKWLRISIVALAVFAGGAMLRAQPAECQWCPTYRCVAPCGVNCPCLTPPGGGLGQCYGVNVAPSLVEQGWRELQ